MTTPRPTLDIVDEQRGEIREVVIRLRRAASMLEAWLAADRPYDSAEGVKRRAYGMIPPLSQAAGQSERVE